MEVPHFSIIIPTFNSAQTIRRCLDSIINQTFKNFEILIIDGFSTDETKVIVNTYQILFAHIRWISEKDRGIYDAMNKGIFLSKGDWLYFMGSDDEIFSPNILQEVYNDVSLDQAPDVLYGNVYSIRFNGTYDGEFTSDKILIRNISHQAIFFNRNVLEKIGNFDLKYESCADWVHNFKWFLSKKVSKKYINLTIANYADGGFSSRHIDDIFLRDKELIYLLSGAEFLPFYTKYTILKKEIRKSIVQKNIRKLFKILRLTPYILFHGNFGNKD